MFLGCDFMTAEELAEAQKNEKPESDKEEEPEWAKEPKAWEDEAIISVKTAP